MVSTHGAEATASAVAFAVSVSRKVNLRELTLSNKCPLLASRSLKVKPQSLKIKPQSLKVKPQSLKVKPQNLKVKPQS